MNKGKYVEMRRDKKEQIKIHSQKASVLFLHNFRIFYNDTRKFPFSFMFLFSIIQNLSISVNRTGNENLVVICTACL
jgi:hypothetical protein